jgi:hypothetical protein
VILTPNLQPSAEVVMTLNELQRIKQWHVAHRADHPVEYHLWDAILTLWVMGWVGFLPAYAFGDFWILLLCALAVAAPSIYADWRLKAHRKHKLRCDWLRS